MLGKFTISGLAKDATEDFIVDVYQQVQDRYDKASDKEKKDFNVLQNTKEVLFDKLQKIVDDAKKQITKEENK